MSPSDKPILWLHGEVKTPPFSEAARLTAGFLLRRLQKGEGLALPHSRPMPAIGPHAHELRIADDRMTQRVVYSIEEEAIVVLEVFAKKTAKTPKVVIDNCKARLKRYHDE